MDTKKVTQLDTGLGEKLQIAQQTQGEIDTDIGADNAKVRQLPAAERIAHYGKLGTNARIDAFIASIEEEARTTSQQTKLRRATNGAQAPDVTAPHALTPAPVPTQDPDGLTQLGLNDGSAQPAPTKQMPQQVTPTTPRMERPKRNLWDRIMFAVGLKVEDEQHHKNPGYTNTP